MLESLMYLVPELVLVATLVAVLLFEMIVRPRSSLSRLVVPALTLAGLAVALVVVAAELWFNDSFARVASFGGLLAHDGLALVARALVLSATGLAVILGLASPALPARRRVEYHGLLLLLALGMCLLASASHLLMIYVALEAVSLSSYLLAGFDDRGGRSTEAGLKYVLFGGVASAVMLFGFSLFYGLTGQLSLDGVALALSSGVGVLPANGLALLFAAVLVLAGFGFKVAAVPFHMWCPDVYEGAPTPFTALLSVGPKVAGFAVLLRFGGTLWPAAMGEAPAYVLLLGVMATATMFMGNLVAIWQDNIKRLLAYSSIAHAGYLLLGVTVGGERGVGAVAVYLAVYVVMNLGAFAVVAAVDRAGGGEDIAAYRGLGARAPLLALSMTVFLVSLAGLPPTAGFIGKLYVFAALIEHGGFWYVALAVAGVLNAVISLYFYARIIKAMYLEASPSGAVVIGVATSPAVLAVLLAVPTLALGVFWRPLAALARVAASGF